MKKFHAKTNNLKFFVIVAILILCSAKSCNNVQVSKFVSNDQKGYLEVKKDNNLRKIFTEYQQNYKAIVVFDELNNPELLKMSFTDSLKQPNVWTIEFRQKKGVPSLGKGLVENAYIKRLNSSDAAFNDWKERFSSFPVADPSLTRNFVIGTAPGSFGAINIIEGDRIVYRIKDQVCRCQNGGTSPSCGNANLKCALDNLCAAADCYESNNWTDECKRNLDVASECLRKAEQQQN